METSVNELKEILSKLKAYRDEERKIMDNLTSEARWLRNVVTDALEGKTETEIPAGNISDTDSISNMGFSVTPHHNSFNIVESYIIDISPLLGSNNFDVRKYLADHLDTLPSASVEACVTKEDCDNLLERLGIK